MDLGYGDLKDDSYSLRVAPGGSLRGLVSTSGTPAIPGDKSLSHRASLLAAMAEGYSIIRNFLVAGVTRSMLDALNQLGIEWQLEGNTLHVTGIGMNSQELAGKYLAAMAHLDCGNSGTTLRLLAGAIAAWGKAAILDGTPGLRRRPMMRIVNPLKEMGVNISAIDGCAPITITDAVLPLHSIDHTLNVASAQVKSCLLLAGLSADGIITLREPGPSRDHTERMLRGMGCEVISEIQMHDGKPIYQTRISPLGKGILKPLNLTLPGDISATAFLIVAALIIPGSELTIQGVGLNPTRTGLLDALREMGAQLTIANVNERGGEPVGDLIVKSSTLNGSKVNGDLVVRMIDEFPAFAVAAACSEGKTVIADAYELRNKESDRISVLCSELGKLGIQTTETRDGFEIEGGGRIHGGLVQSHGDHRLAMALSIAGLAAEDIVEVGGASIMEESFPEFDAVLRYLGARIDRIPETKGAEQV